MPGIALLFDARPIRTANIDSGHSIKGALLFVIMIVCSVSTSYAQLLNVEQFRFGEDTTKSWAGTVDFGITATKQKTSVVNLLSNTNLTYHSDQHNYLLLNRINLVNVAGDEVVSTGFFHGRTTLFGKQAWSPELFMQYQYDAVRGLQNRLLEGGSIRYQWLKRPHINGYMGVGAMHEWEEWSRNEEHVSVNTFKSTNYCSISGELNEYGHVTFITYYQAPFGSFLKPRIISDLQVGIELSTHLALLLQFSATYDADPVLDIEKFIYTLSNSLQVQF